MIDNQDKQTQSLDLEPAPKRRGRPAKQNALSNAERQRLYRERQKAQRNEIERELHNAYATSKVDEAYSEDIWQELEQAKARIIELEAQLAQRNGKPAKVKRHRDQPAAELPEEGIPDTGIWTVQFMMKKLGKRTWDSCSQPQIDFEGEPDKFDMVKRHVDGMNRAETAGNAWRAVRDDGLIYEPKAPKSKRKQPAKP